MNHHIKQLAEQAGMNHERWNTTPQFELFLEKFAQLVVLNCAQICENVGVAVFAEPVQNNRATAQVCGHALKQHFGVAE